jgi:radical SAM/Cys-rich protein
MATPPKLKAPRTSLLYRGEPLASVDAQLALLNRADLGADESSFAAPHSKPQNAFDASLEATGRFPLQATGIDTFQLNLGRVCNQTCMHCHVDAGPDRKENMDHATAELAMSVLAGTDIPTVDITGGAPEMCPEFKYLVTESRALGRKVLNRCNLTILFAKGFEDLPEFFAENKVEVICSLPHHRALNTDKQRGDGVFDKSIRALKLLNGLGYGKPGTGLRIVVVTNPVGAFLPAGQASQEGEWKRALYDDHGVVFNELFSITNMPISRYLEWLESTGNLDKYLLKLKQAYNPVAADGVMCRTTLSVDWKGNLYDCDFNQMLEIKTGYGAPTHLSEFSVAKLAKRRIVTDRHCFGCTAGTGSSCGGSLTE